MSYDMPEHDPAEDDDLYGDDPEPIEADVPDLTKSGTKHPELFARLAAPFHPTEVKTRSQGGRQFHYITARTAMNRLDSVLGPENWTDEFKPLEHGVACKLTITLPDGKTVSKTDAGADATMQDPGDNEKAAYSDAFKRSCAKFGVGRYLYGDGVPDFADAGEFIKAHPPQQSRPTQSPQRQQQSRNGSNEDAPTDGRGLFKWAKWVEEDRRVPMVKYLDAWGKSVGLPWKMAEWTKEDVAQGYSQGCDYLSNPDTAWQPPASASRGARR
jgi:hypothetical protein